MSYSNDFKTEVWHTCETTRSSRLEEPSGNGSRERVLAKRPGSTFSEMNPWIIGDNCLSKLGLRSLQKEDRTYSYFAPNVSNQFAPASAVGVALVATMHFEISN